MTKTLAVTCILLLAGCASAPQPRCMPPEVTRAPEASGGFGPVPVADSGAQDAYARCKELEAEERADAEARKSSEEGLKREAEQLERERREMEQQKPEETPGT